MTTHQQFIKRLEAVQKELTRIHGEVAYDGKFEKYWDLVDVIYQEVENKTKPTVVDPSNSYDDDDLLG